MRIRGGGARTARAGHHPKNGQNSGKLPTHLNFLRVKEIKAEVFEIGGEALCHGALFVFGYFLRPKCFDNLSFERGERSTFGRNHAQVIDVICFAQRI